MQNIVAFVNIGANVIYWLVSVHKNKQSYSNNSPSQEEEEYIQEVETIIKNQLKTEYEFYNYIKQRLQGQAKTIHVMLREKE